MLTPRYLLILLAAGVWLPKLPLTSATVDNGNSHRNLGAHDCSEHDSEHWCTDEVAVKIDGDAGHADHVAEIHGFKNTGQVRFFQLYEKVVGGF